jgi:hypothetical protein
MTKFKLFFSVISVVCVLVATSARGFSGPCSGPEPEPEFSQQSNLSPIRVADASFARHILNNCPTKRLDAKSRRPSTLYLWTRIEGGLEAVAKLRRDGRLPIIHRWYALVGTEIHADGYENIEVAESMGADAEKLLREVNNRSVFDWRTQSYKEHLLFEHSSYRVEVRDQKGAPIPCADNIGCELCEDGIKCAVRLDIQ